MHKSIAAFTLGLAAGIGLGFHYDEWGEGSGGDRRGDYQYTWWRFYWRGRRIEFHLEDARA